VGTTPGPGKYSNVPGIDVLALSCLVLSDVPYEIRSGFDHKMAGFVFGTTTSETVANAVVYFSLSVGVKVTERVCVPTSITSPIAGE
jgi:hypothetical protein